MFEGDGLLSVVGVQEPEVTFVVLHEEVSLFRSPSHDGEEVLGSHDFDDALEVFGLRLIQPYPGHDQDQQHFPIRGDLGSKDAVVVADGHPVLFVELVDQLFDDKAALARRKPFKLFFGRGYFPADQGKHLD